MTSPDRRPLGRGVRICRAARRRGGSLAILAVASVVATCGGPPVSSGPTGPVRTPSASPASGFATGSAGLQAIVVDPDLLAILPASIEGVGVAAAPETAAQLITDPGLARSASAVAVGIAVSTGSSAGDDLASASVVQLRPGVFDDAFYESWRADYDQAACAQSGSVSSHIREQIGTHTVEMTVCSGGARTYHTHLVGDILVSVTAVGDRRFGEHVMAGLRR